MQVKCSGAFAMGCWASRRTKNELMPGKENDLDYEKNENFLYCVDTGPDYVDSFGGH